MTEKLTLESPVVQEAKKVYEASNIFGKYGASFADLLSCFQRDLTYEITGILVHMPTGMVGYVHSRYFAGISGRKEQVQLKKDRGAKRRKTALAELESTLPENSDLRLVARTARAAGCEVQILPRASSRLEAATKVICINGHICSVQSTASKRKYAPIYINRKTSESVRAHILLLPATDDGGTLHVHILPAKLVLKTRFGDNTNRVTTVASRGRKPWCPNTSLCLRGYKNAWWVLPKPGQCL